MSTREKVVVWIDGSDGSRAALEFAMAEAVRRGAAVRAVWAIPETGYWAASSGMSPELIGELGAGPEKEGRQMVDDIVAGRDGALTTVPVEARAVPGPAAAVLVEEAAEADLLVVGHRGRGGLRSAVLGSVGMQCILHAPGPGGGHAARRACELRPGDDRRRCPPPQVRAHRPPQPHYGGQHRGRLRGVALERLDLSGNPEVSVSSPIVICGSNRRSLENPGSRDPSPASVPAVGGRARCGAGRHRRAAAGRGWPGRPDLRRTAATAAAVVLSIFSELYPRVMVSTLGAADDLTVQYTASASYALTVLTIVLAVLLPVGLAYPGWIYHVVRTGRCTIPTGTDAPPTSSADAANPVTDRARSPGPRPHDAAPMS